MLTLIASQSLVAVLMDNDPFLNVIEECWNDPGKNSSTFADWLLAETRRTDPKVALIERNSDRA